MNNLVKELHRYKTEAIPISKILSVKKNVSNEYGLNTNFFDPSKHSPPNLFLTKLYQRVYQHTTESSGIKLDN